jgi:nitrate reductase NapE component
MSDNELTAEDFVENDLPHRPLKYSPRHRTELRRFGVLCVGIFVLLFGVALLL